MDNQLTISVDIPNQTGELNVTGSAVTSLLTILAIAVGAGIYHLAHRQGYAQAKQPHVAIT